MEKNRNVDIGKDLEIQPIQDYIEEKQLQWWDHLHRMNEKIPFKIMENKKRTEKEEDQENPEMTLLPEY